MDRREFIKLATCAGIGSVLLPGCTQESQKMSEKPAVTGSTQSGTADLIVVQGNDPEGMVGRGFEALGGIGRFVKSGNTVTIKPNFSFPQSPEQGCTTNPFLVAGVVKMCLQAGAKEVKVIDYTIGNPTICLEKTGIKKAVTAAGGKVYALNNEVDRYFQAVNANGKKLQEFDFSKDVLEADVFINMPILKEHSITNLTMGLKNMMGLIWDRGAFHAGDLDRSIAELAAFKKPNLTILDAIRGITAKGPRGPGPVKEYNEVIFGTDPVAVDAYGANLFGIKPAKIHHVRIAAEIGLGQLDWEKLNVKRV